MGRSEVWLPGRSVYPLARIMGSPGLTSLIRWENCRPVMPGIDWASAPEMASMAR